LIPEFAENAKLAMRTAWVTVAVPCLEREFLRRLLLDLEREMVGDSNNVVVSSTSGRAVEITPATSSSSSLSSSSSSKSSPA